MGIKKKNLSKSKKTGSAKDCKFGIVVSDWNEKITSSLLDACKRSLIEHEVDENDIYIMNVPGAFELPLGAKWIASQHKLDAIICLGCIIKGDTKHDEYIANAVSRGIMGLNLALNIPVIFGVLTPNNEKQALDRAGGKYGNKGVEAATTAIKMISIKKASNQSEKRIGF